MNGKAVTLAAKMTEFEKALQSGISGIVRASEIYVAALEEDPRNHEKFKERFAEHVPATAWNQFEAVGRKLIHPRMIMGGISSPVKNRFIKKMPFSLQERVFKRERFPLLTAKGDTLSVDLLEATDEQADQLCNGSTIRTLGEQRAWMESRKPATQEQPVEVMPYTITDGRVSFRRGCVLSKTELRRILTDM